VAAIETGGGGGRTEEKFLQAAGIEEMPEEWKQME
jgi:hypothetical protein